MPHTSILDVALLHPDGSMRALLHVALEEHGYTVTEFPTYAALLYSLRVATGPRVVVVANQAANTKAEEEFFGRLATDMGLARRHRYALLSTVSEWHSAALDVTLCSLGVIVLRVPFHLPDLLAAVAALGGEPTSTDEDSDRGQRRG